MPGRPCGPRSPNHRAGSKPAPDTPAPGSQDGGHPDEGTLTGYAAGSLDRVGAWSVEAHLTACPRCRRELSDRVDPARLARNRSVLLVRVATEDRPARHRLLSRLGIPDHLLRLIAATPSLRRSWLLSVVATLAVVTAEALLAARFAPPAPAGLLDARALRPFVLVAPLLVLAAVAAAFLPMFDPAYRLAVAAPFSGFTLLLIRTISALVAALVPVVAAALIAPGPGWLPAALVLPSLAVCALALTAAAVVGPRAAAVGAGVLWVVPMLWVAPARPALLVVQWHGQFACAGVLLAATALLILRRERFELGWSR